jgi:hypothetical protein
MNCTSHEATHYIENKIRPKDRWVDTQTNGQIISLCSFLNKRSHDTTVPKENYQVHKVDKTLIK